MKILKLDDKVIFKLHGEAIEYRVNTDTDDESLFYLYNDENCNDYIFDALHIHKDKLYEVLDIEEYEGGDFPEVGSLEDLTAITAALHKLCDIVNSTPDGKIDYDSIDWSAFSNEVRGSIAHIRGSSRVHVRLD